jgi:hypothetical protein
MAYQIPTYETDEGISLSNAYLSITDVSIHYAEKQAAISFSIFANAAAATAGKLPVRKDGYVFSGDAYTANFAITPQNNSSSTPTNMDDIFINHAYVALKNLPAMSAILADATVV